MLLLALFGPAVFGAAVLADATGSAAASASAIALVLGAYAAIQSNRSRARADKAAQVLAEKAASTDAFEHRINLSQQSLLVSLERSDEENKALRAENKELRERVDELALAGEQTARECRECKSNLARVQRRLDRLGGDAA